MLSFPWFFLSTSLNILPLIEYNNKKCESVIMPEKKKIQYKYFKLLGIKWIYGSIRIN